METGIPEKCPKRVKPPVLTFTALCWVISKLCYSSKDKYGLWKISSSIQKVSLGHHCLHLLQNKHYQPNSQKDRVSSCFRRMGKLNHNPKEPHLKTAKEKISSRGGCMLSHSCHQEAHTSQYPKDWPMWSDPDLFKNTTSRWDNAISFLPINNY